MTVIQLFGHTGSNVSEANFELVFGGLLEGVMGGLDNECRVVESAPAAMTVEVMTGTFITGGVFARVSAQEVLTIGAADALLPRIDRVVCYRDNATNLVTVFILPGVPNANPVPTALVRAGDIWMISLAQIYVAAAAVSVNRSNIADERRSRPVCGLISPNGSPDALFPLVNNPGQVGGAEGEDAATAGLPDGWGLLADLAFTGPGASGLGVDAGGHYTYAVSGGFAGDDAGWASKSLTIRGINPALRMKFKIVTDITNVRLFCGLGGTLATMVGADAPAATSYVGIQFSTDRGDTTWQFVASDGVAQTIFDSEVTVTANPVSLLLFGDEANDQFTLVLIDQNGNVVAGCTFDDAADNVPAEATPRAVVMGLETRVAATRTFATYQAHLVNRIA